MQVVEASDVILEVVDARDPLGCRCVEVERFIRKVDPSKRVVLLLNKVGASGAATFRAWRFGRDFFATFASPCVSSRCIEAFHLSSTLVWTVLAHAFLSFPWCVRPGAPRDC